MHPAELPYWRHKILLRFLERETLEWIARLNALIPDGWLALPEIPKFGGDSAKVLDFVKVHVHLPYATDFMEIPKYVWGLLPYGFKKDNPVNFTESAILEAALREELKALARSRRQFNTAQMIAHLKDVGDRAVRSVLVSRDKEERMGNPEFLPGFLDYRAFLCGWTARGCFLGRIGQMPYWEIVGRMKREKGAWWGEERDVFFDP